jgi:hypothetical protein
MNEFRLDKYRYPPFNYLTTARATGFCKFRHGLVPTRPERQTENY